MNKPSLSLRFEPFLCALARDHDWTRIQSKRCLFLCLVFIGIFIGWIQAWDMLDRGARTPFDGTEYSCAVTEAFSVMGFAAGLTLAIVMPLSPHVLIRVPLAAFVGAGLTSLTVHVGGVDRFSFTCSRGLLEYELDKPIAWGFLLGAPLCGSLALTLHLLRRTSGKFRLTLMTIAGSLLLGMQILRTFWKHWDYRAIAESGMCGTAAAAFATPAVWLGFVSMLYFSLGVLLLDLASRLREPGMAKLLAHRLRSKLKEFVVAFLVP